MNKRVEPTLPSITPDKDQIDSFQTKRTTAPSSISNTNNNPTPVQKVSSPALTLFLILAYASLAGASWWFYQENIALKDLVDKSEVRISQLEDQLSATGEEMGESTVALRVKLEAMTEKTNKLWNEMDKLWASAWRRNQSEIKELNSFRIKQQNLDKKQNNQLTQLNSSIKDVESKQTEAEFNVNALNEQLSAASSLKAQLSQLNADLTSLQQKSQGRDSQQLEVATSVSELDMTLNLLIERIEKLETSNKNTSSKPTPLSIQG